MSISSKKVKNRNYFPSLVKPLEKSIWGHDFKRLIFQNRYNDLMDKGEDRKRKLEDSIQRYSLLRDAHELESWINDKVCYIKLSS